MTASAGKRCAGRRVSRARYRVRSAKHSTRPRAYPDLNYQARTRRSVIDFETQAATRLLDFRSLAVRKESR